MKLFFKEADTSCPPGSCHQSPQTSSQPAFQWFLFSPLEECSYILSHFPARVNGIFNFFRVLANLIIYILYKKIYSVNSSQASLHFIVFVSSIRQCDFDFALPKNILTHIFRTKQIISHCLKRVAPADIFRFGLLYKQGLTTQQVLSFRAKSRNLIHLIPTKNEDAWRELFCLTKCDVQVGSGDTPPAILPFVCREMLLLFVQALSQPRLGLYAAPPEAL